MRTDAINRFASSELCRPPQDGGKTPLTQQRLQAIDNKAPTVRAHNLDSATAQSATLFRLLRNDHCRYKSGDIADIAKLPFAIRVAPGKQQLVGNSMSARRRRCGRCQSWTRKVQSAPFLRPTIDGGDRVNSFKATDVVSVSKVIHTDNPLQAGQFDKAAYVG
jgi:hypothetical protein